MSDPEDMMDWVIANFSQDMGAYVDETYNNADTLFLGATTYKIMASYWPTADTNPDAFEGDAEQAAIMNDLQKIVFSREPLLPEWSNSVFRNDINVNEIRQMKTAPGKNMLIAGSASVVRQFTDLGLIDEYHLLLHPIILGAGKPLFAGVANRHDLTLLEAKAFTNGAVLLRYQAK